METWHKGVQRKHVQSNIQGECPGTETSRELCICRTRTTYVKEASSVDQKVINGHKNPNDSHNLQIWCWKKGVHILCDILYLMIGAENYACILQSNSMVYSEYTANLLITRNHFVHAPSQWETTLHCNVVSHWLGTYTEWSLYNMIIFSKLLTSDILQFIMKIWGADSIWRCHLNSKGNPVVEIRWSYDDRLINSTTGFPIHGETLETRPEALCIQILSARQLTNLLFLQFQLWTTHLYATSIE